VKNKKNTKNACVALRVRKHKTKKQQHEGVNKKKSVKDAKD